MYASVLWAFPVLMQSSGERQRDVDGESVLRRSVREGRGACFHLSCVPGVIDCCVQARGQDVSSWTGPQPDLKPARSVGVEREGFTSNKGQMGGIVRRDRLFF